MKNLLFLYLLWIPLCVSSINIPLDWKIYTNDMYIYDIQSEIKNNNSETELKNYLLNIARTNLAKQIQVQVHDNATLTKNASNGHSNISYTSSSEFSTNINLNLVQTKTYHNTTNNTIYAIAYINKEHARSFYINDLQLTLNKINETIVTTNSLFANGYKSKAKQEILKAKNHLSKAERFFFWLNIYNTPLSEILQWQNKVTEINQKVNYLISKLNNSNIVYILCSTDLFGDTYPKLVNEIKGVLSTNDYSFTANPSEADWIIKISSTARKYNKLNFGNTNSYFAYVDTYITIDNAISSRKILEDEISIKGGHTMSFNEAAKIAMKDTKKQICKIIIQTINSH